MLTLPRAIVVMLFVSLVSVAPPVFAEENLNLRIDLAGRQRMLTQRMARAACFIAVEVDVQSNKQVLLESRTLFGNSLRTLKMGGGAEGFLQETDETALSDIADIEQIWFKMQRKVTGFTKPGAVTLDELREFSDISTELLTASNYLAITLEDKARKEGSGLSPATALMINLAGRQRMLVQKIGKEACLLQMERKGVAAGAKIDTSTFNETMQVFHESAFGLAFGSRQLGLPAAPTPDIYEENGYSWQRWSIMNALVSALEVDILSERDMRELSWDIEAFMSDLSRTVKLYTAL
ncbi:type IV pili methyl-accepting chemotaxis transducer N-terminal domain-containing protein [Celeribacter sp.]|uniref:type IV pili methyl-accepting chemotaxis transducer N-terminal domain-containing protein n=1 Tax=Celeribacter sp. TaxID=1890673 RepID=UPI003A9532C9